MKMKKTVKGSLLLRLCLVVIAVYVAVTLVSLQMEIRQKRAELDILTQSLEEQRLEKKDLERQLNLGEDEKYLSRIAREKLEMGFSDEHVYKDVTGS